MLKIQRLSWSDIASSSLKSDVFTIVVGMDHTQFRAHGQLLANHSAVLAAMVGGAFQETLTQKIFLPEVDAIVFGNFLPWLYNVRPAVEDIVNGIDMIKLGVLADQYQIWLLSNQICDHIRDAVVKDKNWNPTPSMMQEVYAKMPATSALRRLCSMGFTQAFRRGDWARNAHLWKPVFETFPELGWEFASVSSPNSLTFAVKLGDACNFHDHEKPSEKQDHQTHCPFFLGLPIEELSKDTEVEEDEAAASSESPSSSILSNTLSDESVWSIDSMYN